MKYLITLPDYCLRMINQKFIHKIARYVQLLIFVSYLSHGFIPHHHHTDSLNSSYDINFSHDHALCSYQEHSSHSGEEAHPDCLLCNQLDKEFHKHGLFFKERSIAINVIIKDDFVIFPKEEITENFPILNDFPLITDTVIPGHGLRAPPIS